eukprot:3940683-Rhodomonas_salina.1
MSGTELAYGAISPQCLASSAHVRSDPRPYILHPRPQVRSSLNPTKHPTPSSQTEDPPVVLSERMAVGCSRTERAYGKETAVLSSRMGKKETCAGGLSLLGSSQTHHLRRSRFHTPPQFPGLGFKTPRAPVLFQGSVLTRAYTPAGDLSVVTLRKQAPLQVNLYPPRPTPYTMHPTPYTIHHTPYTIHHMVLSVQYCGLGPTGAARDAFVVRRRAACVVLGVRYCVGVGVRRGYWCADLLVHGTESAVPLWRRTYWCAVLRVQYWCGVGPTGAARDPVVARHEEPPPASRRPHPRCWSPPLRP